MDSPFNGTQLCSKVEDPEIFFPEDYLDTKHLSMVRTICNDCPISSGCLEYALKDPSLEGIWAGTTPRQRLKIRSRRRQLA